MSIRLETIEAESRNSSNNNKNKHQWLLRKCLRIRSSPPKKKKFSISQLSEFCGKKKIVYLCCYVGCTGPWTSIFPHLWMPLLNHLLSLMELQGSLFSLPFCLFIFWAYFCFCFCPIHCLYYMSLFRMFYTLYTKMNLDLFFFFFFKRLYINYACPFAQRVWITRNYKVIFMSFLNSFLDFVLSCSILKLYISSF